MIAAFNVGEWAIATAVMLGALGSFITSIAQLKLGRRTNAKVEAVSGQTADVHEIVNDHATKQEERIEQLAGALQSGGVTIPPSPAKGARGPGS